MHKILVVVLTLLGWTGSGALAGENAPSDSKTAVFAGGCFWCMQPPYDQAKGVVKTIVGYTGGDSIDANYRKVSAHQTKHREAIEVTYDPAQISYGQLLDIFWRQINPTQADGQFHDIGLSYQAAIFYGNDEEKKAAEASKESLGNSGRFQKPIVTEILPATKFYPAEDYHQKYYLKNPADFEAYHVGSGRVSFLEKVWGNPSQK
jgi:peptide methionine sulfoxide reductase msrA/msrB